MINSLVKTSLQIHARNSIVWKIIKQTIKLNRWNLFYLLVTIRNKLEISAVATKSKLRKNIVIFLLKEPILMR